MALFICFLLQLRAQESQSCVHLVPTPQYLRWLMRLAVNLALQASIAKERDSSLQQDHAAKVSPYSICSIVGHLSRMNPEVACVFDTFFCWSSWLYPSHWIPSQVTGVLLVRLWLQLYHVLPVTFAWKAAQLLSPVHQGRIRIEANRLPALSVRKVNNKKHVPLVCFNCVICCLIIFIKLQRETTVYDWLKMTISATQRLHMVLHQVPCSTFQCQIERQHFSSLKGTTVMWDWVQPIFPHWGLALKDITVLQVQPSPPSTPAP